MIKDGRIREGFRSSRILYAISSPPWRGKLLPPSNVRFALCLPFSGFALRPRGYTPLEPPTAFLQTLLPLSAVP
jgi:hypothetical protein